MRESTRTCTGTRFVAFLLIFCMVLQMFSISPKAVRAQEESTTAVTEEQHNPTDNITSNDTIIQESMPTVETKEDTSGSTETTPEQAQTKEREVSDITENTGLVTVALDSLYQTAKGTETIPFENKENTFDLTKAEVQKNLFFKWRIALNKGILKGDTITISLPKTEPQKADEGPKDHFIFKDTQDALALKTPDGIELGSYVIKDNTAVMTLNEAAAKVEDEPIAFDVELETSINQEALKDGKTTEVVVMQQGEKADAANKLTLKLPAKTAELTPEPSPEPEVKKEESKTLDNLKGFFGIKSTVQTETTNNTPTDVTEVVEEIGITFNRLSYIDNNNITYKIKKNGTNFDMSNVNYADVKGLILGLDFNIKCNDETRTIKQGDIFHYYIPEGLVPENENALPSNAPLTFQGVEIAEYSIAKDPAQGGKYKLTVTFTDNVNIEEGYVNIKGGFDINLKFDPEKLGGKDPKEISLKVQSAGEETTLKAPPTIAKVNGITKKGTYNPVDRSISWEIEIGTESKGAPLAGLDIKDTFNAAELEYKQGTAFIGNEKVECTGSGGNYTCKIPTNSKLTAPQTLKLTTTVKDAALTRVSSADISINNAVEMSAPQNAKIIVGDKAKANNTVTIPKTGLQKHGTVLNSDTIKWTIDINNTDVKNTMWNAVLTDKMGKGLQFKKDKLYLTIDVGAREQITVVNKGEVEPLDKNYAVYDSAANSFDLYFKNPNPVRGACTLEYETNIDPQKYPDNQNQNNPDLQNTASIRVDWPNAEGNGPGNVRFNGEIGLGIDFNAADIKKTGNANNQTGEIEWTINPSTRRNSFDDAVITDTIENDQAFIPGSVVIKNGNTTVNTSDVLTQSGNTLTFIFNHNQYNSINDIKITYKTKALDFFKTNNADHTYKNKAELVVSEKGTQFKSQAEPSVTFKNDFLEKATEYHAPSGAEQGYLHYTIKLNQNKLNLTNLHFSDDLSKIVTNVLNIDGKATGSTLANAWVIDKTKTQVKVNGVVDAGVALDYSDNGDAPKVSKNFGSTNSSYEINLYLKLSDSAKTELGKKDCTLQTENTVLAGANELNNNTDFTVTSKGEKPNGQVVNKLANKTNITEENIHDQFKWQVMINPNGATLTSKTSEGVISIEDTLPKGLEFDLSSVSLKNATDNPVASDQFEVKVKADGSGTGTVMTIALKPVLYNVPLTLEYTTVVVGQLDDPNGNFSNHAKLVVDNNQISESSESASVENGAWAYLEKMASFQYTKYDEESGIAKPLPGATFALYKESTKIKEVTSDENGKFTFWGLDVSASNGTYTFQEIKAPEGYALNNLTQTVPTDGKMGLHKGLTVTDKRTTSNQKLEFSKIYKGSSSYSPESGYSFQSQFKLWLYPMGSGVKVQVCVTGNDGNYAYSHTGTPKDGSAEIDVLKDLSNKIEISGLPWGTYAIEETQAALGYAATKDLQKFEVDKDTGVVAWGSGNGTLENTETEIYIAKKDSDKNNVKGAQLTVYKDSNGTQSSEIVSIPLTKEKLQWKTDDSNNPKTIKGLPAGTYWLAETQLPPDNQQVAQAKSIKFSIDAYGQLSGGSEIDAKTKTITMTDKIIQIIVNKSDQFGKAVKDLTADSIVLKVGSDTVSTSGSTDVNKYVKSTLDKNNGKYTFKGLKRGVTYQLVEETTPSGYLTANPITFTIKDDGTIDTDNADTSKWNLNNESGAPTNKDWNFTNTIDSGKTTLTLRDERISGHVQFTKWDNKANIKDPTKFTPLADVKFDLYKKGTSVTADKKINKDGERFVSLNADIDKGKGLVTTVGSELTNNETKEKFKNGLLPGTYYFKEVETHGDFVLPVGDAAKSEEITITDNNRYTWQAVGANQKHFIKEINKSNQFSNTPLKTNIVVKKTDADDPSKGVIGAKYGLYYNDNGKLGDIVSGGLNNVKREIFTQEAGKDTPEWIDTNGNKYIVKVEKNGYGYFCDVKKGDFWVKEIAPAPGYILSTEQKSVSVTDASASKPISVEVTNKQNQITITKTAADTGKPLPGATLALTGKFVNKNGAQDKEATTKSWSTTDEPTKTITGLLVADEIYTLSETSPAWGYKLSDKKVTFKVKLDGTIELTDDAGVATVDDTKENIAFKNEAITAALSKTDQKGLPISDVSFEMKGNFADAPETSAVKTFTTDEKGSINLDKQIIAGQTYTLKETAAPKQYQINPSQIQITVGNDGKLTIKDPSEEVKRITALSDDGTKLTVKNDLKLGNIIFSKKAIEDEGLAETTAREGVTFGIYTDAKCTIPVSQDGKNLTAISAKDGTVSFNNLPAAIYYIKEVPQTGDVTAYYKSNPNIYTANIDGSIEDNTGGVYGITEGDSKDNTVINTAIRGDISLKKVNDEFKTIDAQGQEVTLNLPLSGAIFAVCPKDDPGSIVAAILEKDGTQGEYGLMPAKNINWESGYKVVENNAFGISYLFNNRLLAGEYNIVETTAPAGYTKPENPVAEIHIAEGATNHNSIITNITKKADIPVEKQIEVKTNNQKTEMQAAGEGFSFSLERIAEPSGDALRFHYSAKAKTEQDGKALFAQVPIGQYKVTEMAISGLTEPYVIPEAKIVTVKEDGTVSCENAQKVSFDNYLTQIEFNKAGCISEHCSDTPDLSKPLEGAVFGIYSDPACTQKVQEAVSNGDGIVQFTGMNHGLWYVKEISAPMAYVVDPAVYIANIDEKGHFEALTKADGQKLEDNSILNEAVRGSIKLIKRDEQTGALLPNSTYGLYKKIEAQSRTLSSVSSPQLRDENTEFEQIEGYELITTAITDGKGEILFDGLLTGPEYLVKELKAPDGSKVSAIPIMLSFKLDDTGQGAVIGKADNGNGTAEINPDGTVTWKEPPVMVDIYKQDMKGKNLAGATLRITDKNGNPVEGVDDWVSTTEAHVIMGKLNGGQEYILTEVAAPSGYVMAEPVHFTVSNEPVGPGQDYHEPVYMKDDTTKVQFSKIAITGGAELPGAKLSLKDAEGNVVEEWTSGDKPHLIEGKLTAGASYTLTEITAPQGYEVAENITFKVGTDGKLQTVTMLDKPIITPGDPEKEPAKPISKGPGTGLFETGAQSSLWTMMALLALAALVVCGTVVYRRKH